MEPNTDTTFTLDDVKPRGEPFETMEHLKSLILVGGGGHCKSVII